MEPQENWKPMVELDSIYHISDYGRVKSFKQFPQGKIIQPKKTKEIYLQYCIRHKKKCYTFYAARKVAEYFIPNPDSLPYVDHINNKDKFNNHVSNLQWMRHDENVRKDQAKIIICSHTSGKEFEAKGTRHGAELTGISRANIQYALKKFRPTKTGWSFKYKK